jgi:ribosomal protein L29
MTSRTQRTELRQLTPTDLASTIERLQGDVVSRRLDHGFGRAANHRATGTARRALARAYTIQRERHGELAESKEQR